MNPRGVTGKNRVEAVDRALSVLEAFAEGRTSMSLKELAEATGLYKSTILRLCGSLEAYGYLRRGADGRFRLGAKLWLLGNHYQQGFDLEVYVRPILRQIVEETGETASFFVPDKDHRVCLYRENSRQPIRHAVEEGLRLPLDRGAAGRVLRVFSSGAATTTLSTRIREQGYYFSQGERDPYAAAVAAPVFGANDNCVGALAISGLRERFGPGTVRRLGKLVVGHARELNRLLGSGQNAKR